MSIISKKLKKYVPDGYVTLQKVYTIEQDDIEANKKWAFLREAYEEVENARNLDWMHWLLPSLFNAILYQEKIYFVFSRDIFRREVMKKDENWSEGVKPPGFGDTKWPLFTQYLRDEGILELYNKGSNNTKIYKVINEELLSHLKIDEEKQLQEAIEYSKNPKKKGNDIDTLELEEAPHELQHELQHQEERSKKKEESKIPTKQLLSFKDFIYSQCTEVNGGIESDKEYMYYLAEDAVANAEVDPESHSDKKMFGEYLKKKLGHGKMGYVNILTETFNMAVGEILAARTAASFDFKAPAPVTMQSVKREVDKERIRQEKVSMMLRLQFSGGTVAKLKEELAQETDELERKRIMAELEIWGG